MAESPVVVMPVPILADENNVLRRRASDDANRSRMHDDLARALMTCRFNHAIFANLNVATLVSNA